MLKISSSINACMDISENGLSHSYISSEAVVYGFHWHTKGIDEAFFHLKLKLNTLGFWSITIDKSLQDWSWANAGAVRRKMKWLQTYSYTDMKFLPWIGVGNSLLKFVASVFDGMIWYLLLLYDWRFYSKGLLTLNQTPVCRRTQSPSYMHWYF
jgi:hypothetical protein